MLRHHWEVRPDSSLTKKVRALPWLLLGRIKKRGWASEFIFRGFAFGMLVMPLMSVQVTLDVTKQNFVSNNGFGATKNTLSVFTGENFLLV